MNGQTTWRTVYSSWLMDKETTSRLSELIRTARGDRSQREYAESVGVTQFAVHHWESGESFPGLESLIKIAVSMGMTTDDLVRQILNEDPIVLDTFDQVLTAAEKLQDEEKGTLAKRLIDQVIK